MMHEHPSLSETEWDLIIELLQRELESLPVEIHHTRTASVRQELTERRQMIRDMLSRLQPAELV
jgi:hypothetical protein